MRAKPVFVAAPEEVQRLKRRIYELEQASQRNVNIWVQRCARAEIALERIALELGEHGQARLSEVRAIAAEAVRAELTGSAE